MGFFENLGRKVEEFKRTAEETAAEEATHGCRSCGERFYRDHDECPACGADAVVARARDPDGSDGSSGPDDSEGSSDAADGSGANDETGTDRTR